jgi:hypothetical protein
MLFETKNGSISILYGRQSHDPLDTHTHASINNAETFQMGSNSTVPRENPRDSRLLPDLHSSNHGLKETLGKMECENLPVSATSQLFCHSSNILCCAIGIKSRATDCALYTILPKVASKSALSFPAIPTCAGTAGTHMKLTSRPLCVSCQHFCLHSYTNGWVCSEIFRDFIALIELRLSVKFKYLPSASFSIWFSHVDRRKLHRESIRWPLIRNSILSVGRQNQPLHPSNNAKHALNSSGAPIGYISA